MKVAGWRVDLDCAAEAARLSRRHPRYLFAYGVLAAASLADWGRSRPLRAGLALAQRLDDALDGDLPTAEGPLTFRDGLLERLASGALDARRREDRLGACVAGADGSGRALASLGALAATLGADLARRQARASWPEARLRDHHRETFRRSLDFLLALAGSAAQGADFPELVDGLAWCSPDRDLAEDAASGLDNVPAEVAGARGGPGGRGVALWRAREAERAWGALRAAALRLPEADAPAHRLASPVLRGLRAYAARLPAGPLPSRPLAAAAAGRAWFKDPYAFLDREARRRGPTFWLRLPLMGEVLVLGDPAMLREAAVHPDLAAGGGVSALRRVLGGTLIELSGPDHAARRRLLAPLLTADPAAYDGAYAAAARAALTGPPRGVPFPLEGLARRALLGGTLRLLFGDLPAAAAARARGLAEDFLAAFASPALLFLRPLQCDLGPWSPWGRGLRRRDALAAFIAERLAAARRGKGAGVSARLVEAAPGLPDAEAVAEVLALLLFGHDTAAAALSWGFAHLFAHPGAFARAAAEAAAAPEPRPEATPFLAACLAESQRLCPVVVHVTRTARRTLRLGGWYVPRGARVAPCAYLAHRSPEHFPEPEAYRPERFLGAHPDPGAYLPFGLGDRVCVGRTLALRQMAVTAAAFLREAPTMRPAPDWTARPERRNLLVAPAGGVPVVL